MNEMPKKYGWNFPVETKGTWKGFNNDELERFKKGRYKSLVREVIQNSSDANDSMEPSPPGPARVVFTLEQMPIEFFPDLPGFKEKLDGCEESAKSDGKKEQAIPWFQRAQKIVNQKTIPVLKMSDFNTPGIEGPCERGHAFWNFMKAMGDPNKAKSNAAGGHGIGKRAPLVSSNLRTLITSTVYLDKKGHPAYLCQGLAILMSHQRKKKGSNKLEVISYEGYWGDKEDCMPFDSKAYVPEYFHRSDLGTDLFLLGFDASKEWEKKVIAHALTSFFAAFARGTLEFKVGDFEVTRENVSEWFSEVEKLEACLDDQEEKQALRNARYFYEAIVSGEEPPYFNESRQVKGLGEIEVKLAVREGLPQEICLVRKNMVILNEFPGMKRFPNYKDFVAVIECKSQEGETLIRSIEPSRHDSLEFDQLESEEERALARAAVKRLSQGIREVIKRHALDTLTREGTIDFLSQFFPNEDAEGSFEACERDPQGRVSISPRKITKTPSIVRVPDPPEPLPPSPPGPPNPGPVPPVPPTPPSPEDHMNIAEKTRVIEKPDGNHRLAFSVNKPGHFIISVFAVGLESDRKLNVMNSNIGKVHKGDIHVQTDSSTSRFVADVSLERKSEGAYRITCKDYES